MAISDPRTTLTPRQLELVAMFASGYDYKGIAEAKFLSYTTVRHTLERARKAVGAASLTHLCTLAVESGVIERNGVGFKPVVDPYAAGED